MLILINSTVKQAGVSTLANTLAYTISSWTNRPTLIVSVATDRFYKSKSKVKEEYSPKFLSIVNGNSGSHGELKTYMYKINDLLFYYQAHSSPSASYTQHRLELNTFLERAAREFGMVILDLDEKPNDIIHLLDKADYCFTVLPADKMVLENTRTQMEQVVEAYREKGGLAVKTVMAYIINKIDPKGMTKGTAAKLLGSEQRLVFTLPYDIRIMNEGNNNNTYGFLAHTLLHMKGPDDKVLETSLKRVYDLIKST